MSLDDVRDLREQLNAPGGAADYAARLEASMPLVVEWRWATELSLPRNPHARIAHGESPVKWLKTPPRTSAIHHGLDASGRLIVSRHFYGETHEVPDAESFFIYDESGFCQYSFRSVDGVQQRCDVQRFDTAGPRWLRSLQLFDAETAIEESLDWVGDQLQRHSRHWWKGLVQKTPNTSLVYDYHYDDNGVLLRADEHWESASQIGKTTTAYLRLPDGVTLKSLLAEVEDGLIRLIPPTLQATGTADIVDAILMEYTGTETDPTGSIPPLIIVTAALRQQILAGKPSAEWPYHAWASPELRQLGAVEVIVCDQELEDKLKLIFQLTIKTSNPRYAPVRKMFQSVCTRLNLSDWQGILVTGNDFVVLPVDPHGEIDFDKDVNVCIPQATADRLRHQGLLKTKGRRKP